MKAIKIDLPMDIDAMEIHPLADLHIGDSCCDFRAIQAELEYIKNTDHCYAILDGDLMDTAIAGSIGDTYGANLQPMEQLKQCVKLFEPIKDKILAVTPGNHENRPYKTDGIDMTAMMCAQLGISERYSETSALLFLRFGKDVNHGKDRKMAYTVYVTHGSGGGRKEGGKIQRIVDLSNIVDADVYIMAHVHQPAVVRNAFFRADRSSSGVYKCEHVFVNTASWLDYGGYGDRQGLRPCSNTNPVIVLDGHRKRIRVTL